MYSLRSWGGFFFSVSPFSVCQKCAQVVGEISAINSKRGREYGIL